MKSRILSIFIPLILRPWQPPKLESLQKIRILFLPSSLPSSLDRLPLFHFGSIMRKHISEKAKAVEQC